MAAESGVESVLWDDWHVVAECGQLADHGRVVTKLFGLPIVIEQGEAQDAPRVYLESGGAAHSAVKYGYVWACLGTPARAIVDFAECADDDRWVVNAGAFGVAVSGLRAVENFLDMSHLCFVHAGYLGEEPHTEVKKYKVSMLPEGGVMATECKFYQPLASPVATEGFDVDYVYTILRPYTIMLHKANPVQPTRSDMIALFVQPYSEERCIAYMLLVYLKDDFDRACRAPVRAADLQSGQADFGKPAAQAPAAEPARRNPDPRRCGLCRLSHLAEGFGRPLRRNPGMSAEIHCTDRVATRPVACIGRAGRSALRRG